MNNNLLITTILEKINNDNEILTLLSNKININSEIIKENIKNFLNQNNNEIKIYIDGGSRGNPGISGCGIVIDDNISKIGYYYYLGEKTNNHAEYIALIKALELAINYKYKNIIIYTDSQLVFKQITLEFSVKDKEILNFFEKSLELINKFDRFKIYQIPRDNNKYADRLANLAMDLKKDGKIELTTAI